MTITSPSRPTRRRVLAGAVAGATALLLAAGCAAPGPAAPEIAPGVAAVVGDRTVSAEVLTERVRTMAPDLAAALQQRDAQQGRVSRGLDPTVVAEQSRSLLTSAILHEVIEQASARAGVVVSPDQVDAQLAAAGGDQALAGTGFDRATLRELIADQIAVAELGRREFDRLAVTLDVGTFPNRADAQRAAQRLATEPGTQALDALPAGARLVGTVLRPGAIGPDGQPQTSPSSFVFGLPGGTVSLSSAAEDTEPGTTPPDPATQPWTVVRVRERATDAPPAPGTVPASLLDTDSLIQFGIRTIQPLAVELGVRVNPRYGTWDPTQTRVVAPPAAAGEILPWRAAPAVAP